MKVSINLANEYSNVDLKNISTDLMVEKIGSQLGAIEEVISWASKYQGIVVVKLVECIKHPNADKLSVCMIDDGGVIKNVERDSRGLVQVVCGAPNVKKDMFVAWIPPRAIVPSTRDTDDEFTLEARELRGVVSNGMLASAHELAINEDHSGILEISHENSGKEPKPGDYFVNYYGLDDVVVDCENKMFTHRPDCFGVLGVARELAGINGLNFVSPDWYKEPVSSKISGKLPLESQNDIKKLVSRFMLQVVENVNIKNSNLKIQIDLARNGYRSLNNIVDYTNYYMHLTAQPTHAFDYDKVKALSGKTPTIFPRMAKEGEELKLLSGKTIRLTKEDIVIATDKKAIALAGVMGGAETEVDENTKNIIIECATFDMYTIRKTSMRHGLFTDAVSRFNKGQSPLQNDKVLAKLVSEVNLGCGSIAGKLIDIKDVAVKDLPSVSCGIDFINNRLGRVFETEEVADLLLRTEFSVKVKGENLIVQPPYWRRDIKLPEDIVEEVGRLFGFYKLPTELPSRKSVVVTKNKRYTFKRELAHVLQSYGANEVLTYSFVHGDLIKNVGQSVDNAYQLRNAISPDLQYYRLSLTPSLLANIHQNIKAGYGEFAIFEIGQTHNKKYGLDDESVPVEKPTAAFVYSSSDKISKNQPGAPYYKAIAYVGALLNKFGIKYRFENLPNNDEIYHPFDTERSALIVSEEKGEIIGVVGEYAQNAKEKLKIPKHSAGFELYVDVLNDLQQPTKYKILSRFPLSEQDLTLKTKYHTKFQDVYEAVQLAVNKFKGEYDIQIEPIGIYSEDLKEKNLSFRFKISHSEKTLRTEEVNDLLEDISNHLSSTVKTVRV